MKTKIFIFALLTCMVAFAGAQELKGTAGHYRSEITKEFDVKPGGTVKVETGSGDIEVQSWAQDKVSAFIDLQIRSFTKGEAKEVLKRLEQSIHKTGNTVNVKFDMNRMPVNAKIFIKTPKNFNLDLHTSGGDILIQEIDGKSSANTSGGDIVLKKIGGSADVKTSGGDITLSSITGKVNARTSGGDISLDDIHAFVSAHTSGGDIDVNDIFAEIDIKTSGGDLDIQNVEKDISAKTSGGDIDVKDCKGNCSVHTSGGDIELMDITGKVHANTSGGDISGNNLQNDVEAKTSGGDITLKQIDGAVSAKTSGGDVAVSLTGKKLGASDEVTCASSGGNIELEMPANLGADIYAKIELRDRHNMNRYDIYSDFPLVKTESKEDDEIVSTGKVNGGGAKVTLTTTNGNIHIKKK